MVDIRYILPLLGVLLFALACIFYPAYYSSHISPEITSQNEPGRASSNIIKSPPIYSNVIKSPLIYSKYASSTSTYRINTYPHVTTATGSWSWVGNDWWTSGFFPATLYLLHERSQICPGSTAVNWLERARKWSEGIIPLETFNTVDHDTGFLAYPLIEELRVNPTNSTAKDGIKTFAAQLARRFNGTVGCTRSWESGYPEFVVIMDNMMNLELLYKAADILGGLESYYEIAASHANKTAINHLRPDASSYHIVDYDQTNGNIIDRRTGQGYADWSTWSRGQAWGVYGFSKMYNRTSHLPYLEVGRRMGQNWLRRLAEDSSGVPNWDFDAPKPASKDTSAAAVASVAFLQLYYDEMSLGNSTGAAYWKETAGRVLSATADQYFQPSTSWDSILSNGTSNYPIGVYNTGLVYGDYYFVKAGNMMLELGLLEC